jgi:fumarate hydratase class I
MDSIRVHKSMYELIRRTCTELPADILKAMNHAHHDELPGSIAQETLGIILESASLSHEKALPLCQDTGALLAIIQSRPGKGLFIVEEAIVEAVKGLTREGILRQNCVDPLTERNTGDNTGAHVPQVHFEPAGGPVRVSVMLKGGGSENMSTQYSLPSALIAAGRDLDGVRRCILDSVYQAQGQGCSPGILGVCIGGDRASGYLLAKRQLFRHLEDVNPVPVLASMEETILQEANGLGLGPMGLGGRTTLLGCKIGTAGRHPASYFVTVSYSCWATRRYCVELDGKGGIRKWI